MSTPRGIGRAKRKQMSERLLFQSVFKKSNSFTPTVPVKKRRNVADVFTHSKPAHHATAYATIRTKQDKLSQKNLVLNWVE
jgi:hypothetical protein